MGHAIVRGLFQDVVVAVWETDGYRIDSPY